MQQQQCLSAHMQGNSQTHARLRTKTAEASQQTLSQAGHLPKVESTTANMHVVVHTIAGNIHSHCGIV